MIVKMLPCIIFIIILLCLSKTSALKDCPIDYQCNNTYIKVDDKVGFYCLAVYKQMMTGRCCSLNNSIIGLDLRYCDVKILNISQTPFLEVEILDLRENDYDKLTVDELLGLLKLDYLYLEPHIPCPGGNTAWNNTDVKKTETFCSNQLDYCDYLKRTNITCGTVENARCVRLGPGSAKCDCQPGYYGYKCLQQGIFPTAVFVTSVVIPTVVLSIALWFIQGRDPYRMHSIVENQ